MENNFYNYVIKKYKGKDSPEGDFAYDLENDRLMPLDKSDNCVFNHLNSTYMDVEVSKIYKKLKKKYREVK